MENDCVAYGNYLNYFRRKYLNSQFSILNSQFARQRIKPEIVCTCCKIRICVIYYYVGR